MEEEELEVVSNTNGAKINEYQSLSVLLPYYFAISVSNSDNLCKSRIGLAVTFAENFTLLIYIWQSRFFMAAMLEG